MNFEIHDPDMPNFLEKMKIEEANRVNLDIYRYDDGLSAKRGSWCFVRRQRLKHGNR